MLGRFFVYQDRRTEKQASLRPGLVLRKVDVLKFINEVSTLSTFRFSGKFIIKLITFGVSFPAEGFLSFKNITLKELQSTFEVLIGLLVQVCRGLNFLHENHVLHNDLKPENVLLEKDLNSYSALITDFGEACFYALDPHSGSVLTSLPNKITPSGTEYIKAPERIIGQVKQKLFFFSNSRQTYFSAVSPASDIWSLGCLIFEVIVNEILFPEAIFNWPEFYSLLTNDSSSNAFDWERRNKLMKSTVSSPSKKEKIVKLCNIMGLVLVKDKERRATGQKLEKTLESVHIG
eukprot:snap_masked-scaffold_5-processed-gene-10.6-mRNA-1 protein AED:0.99 eAED:1.00 QI:0/0/0/0.33/1/1/3/0/289